jgi:hypothetical protein
MLRECNGRSKESECVFASCFPLFLIGITRGNFGHLFWMGTSRLSNDNNIARYIFARNREEDSHAQEDIMIISQIINPFYRGQAVSSGFW